MRLTNTGSLSDPTDAHISEPSSPPSTDLSSQPQDNSSPHARSDGIGLTHSTIRLAILVSRLALTFNPVGHGEENTSWWESGGQKEVAAAAQRLLETGQSVERQEREQARQKRKVERRMRDEGENEASLHELRTIKYPVNGKRDQSKHTAFEDQHGLIEQILSGSKGDLNAQNRSPHNGAEAPSEEHLPPTEIAARKALQASTDGLVGQNWVGIANLEEQRRRRWAFQERRDRRKLKESGRK
jgi:hypothetical protein